MTEAQRKVVDNLIDHCETLKIKINDPHYGYTKDMITTSLNGDIIYILKKLRESL